MGKIFETEKDIVVDGPRDRAMLGQGASGKVYRVRHATRPGPIYAMKVIPRMGDEEMRHVRKEIACQQGLSHPNIVRLEDVLWLPNRVCLFFELVTGGDLYTFLKRYRLAEDELVILFRQVCAGIQYIHGQGLMHRDIKPENVLMTADKQPKVGDFGFSAADNGEVRITFCGTFEYMSPEVFDRRPQTQKSDIWALGILLYEMLCHRPPFPGQTADEVLRQLRAQRVMFPPTLNPDAIALISNMLRINPQERPTINIVMQSPLLLRSLNRKPDNSRMETRRAATPGAIRTANPVSPFRKPRPEGDNARRPVTQRLFIAPKAMTTPLPRRPL